MAAEDWFDDDDIPFDNGAFDPEPVDLRPTRLRRSGEPGMWTTARGETLKIRDMDDRHLLNTIAFVERDYRGLQDTFCDGALDINLLWPQHAYLVAEARRRRLIPVGRKNELVTS